jgi:hypothetical protein
MSWRRWASLGAMFAAIGAACSSFEEGADRESADAGADGISDGTASRVDAGGVSDSGSDAEADAMAA